MLAATVVFFSILDVGNHACIFEYAVDEVNGFMSIGMHLCLCNHFLHMDIDLNRS
jgi:hypothetical protein